MAKNAGESRIPLPRTVRPSLLPKIRSLGPPKISSAGHRRSPVYCSPSAIPGAPQFNNKQQQQHFGFGKRESANLVVDSSNKQSKSRRSTPDTEKDCLLDSDYSISAIWNCTTDNKEAEHLMRLNEEKLNLLRSQEDLASFGGIKKKPLQLQQSHEDVSDGGGGNPCNINTSDFAIESPVATAPHYLMLTKQNSFEHDESSLGILTPDQMTDFTVALESSRTPSCENLSGHANPGKFLLGKSNAIVAAAARHLDIAACVPSIEALIPQNDRSPSLEELPLDPIVIVHEDVDLLEETLCSGEEIPTILQQPADLVSEQSSKTSTSTTTAIDSTETSEHTSDQQTRCSAGVVGGAHVLPTSFITSVTSITSLEAGYQGDGENSRPASRGPEPLSITPASNLLVSAACRQDPMTDSDFFTESDADAHEEIVRGDRRAQVIDGTLFCAPNERRCRSFEPGEEMDSSGIYSDLDKRQDSVGIDGDGYAEGYGDGDHTTDTGDTEISMRSQPSPQEKTPMPALVTKNMLTPQDLNDSLELNSTASTAELTVIKCQKNEQNAVTKSKSNISNKENSAPLKKYKMPKRNVISKIKTMIESNQNLAKEETESEPRRPQRQQRKNGRWDAVMNKIEAGKQRGRSLKKEVKSRVLQGLGTSTSSTASTSSTRRPAGDANNNAKDKRRARGRPETTSPNQETARSSVRSSASDLSSAHSKEALKRPTRKNCMDAHQPNNNQLNSNLNKSNLSSVRKAPSIKSVQSNVNSKQKNATTNKVADRNTANNNNNNNNRPTTNNSASTSPLPANNKEQSNGPTTILNNNNHHLHHHHHLNNHNHVHQSSAPTSRVATPTVELNSQKLLVDTREQEIQTDLQLIVQDKTEKDLLDGKQEDWFKKAEDTVQALAITVQYFTHQLEDVSESRIRKDLDKVKTEWLSARSELEELRVRKASILDALSQEREEHLQAIESLREDLERELAERSSLEQSYIEERHRVETLQDSLQEKEREQRLALERLNSEHELELAHARTVAAQTQEQGALLAEVESLRTVLEIRSQENSQLRSEVDILRRELDDKEALKLRCESLEARCEDLKAQLQSKESIERQLAQDKEVLMGSIHQMSKQNKRLSQRNEELLWRLRQKSEVVSVLTNQLTPQSQRLSKSLGPEHTDHAANDSNCSQKSQEQQSCSMVKYMVEKGDSVSWTLDITESMDSTINSSAASCTKTPSPSARRFSNTSHHESNGGSNGTFVSRQSSLRLSMPRRTTMTAGRTRSNSVSVAESSANASTNDEPVWSPSYQSTPLQRRRNVTSESPQSWSLTNTVTETMCTSTSNAEAGNNVISNSSNTKVVALEVSTTDEDEEEDEEEEVVGQRPQEAGGEAMISEETSASSSSEDDESSVSSSDIP
ncbi:general transcriptional corepressor trfA isoform X2 [Nasonia vitripennis]|uniref:Microtubule-associated tumor suppressor 1 n=2 Tax=Nasonia vitripennis TaxID=7425 RepID=A0A7M7T8H4_NASVI|nr:general transcriptional corepressor trfA isoform X2 [Nasonia vitripennis]